MPTSPLAVNVVELLRRPATRRAVRTSVEARDVSLGGEARVPDGAPVEVDLVLESLTDGATVSGTVRTVWTGTCRRCLGPAEGRVVAEVHELYQAHPTSEDAFAFDGEQIDLEPMVRELVLMELPLAPLCRDDCAGLCPTCGADLNAGPCGCARDVRDPRWAALDALREAPEAGP
jgi:uncharacterized protein